MTTIPGPAPTLPRPTATDAIRRSFDNSIANWPLLLIRIAETVLFGMIAMAGVLAVVVPLAVSAGLSHFDRQDATATAEAVLRLIAAHWMLLIWSLVIALVLVVVFALLHSFVIAGTTRVLVDGDRAAGASPSARSAYRQFTVDRWVDGGRDSWWAIFWIYNLAYGSAAVVVLVPALLVLVVMLALHGSVAAIVAGCIGLVLLFFLGAVLAMLTGIWCQKAIVVCVVRQVDGREALRIAWQEGRRDLGRHLTVAFVILVITIGGIGVISTFSMLVTIPGTAVPATAMFFLPLRMLVSLVESVYGAAAGNLGLAAFAAITESR